MKMILRALGVGLGLAAAGLAEPEKPTELEVAPPPRDERDLGLYVFPEGNGLKQPGQDLMLKRLMAEMLREVEQDQKNMEAPVELPKLDVPKFQSLRSSVDGTTDPPQKRWTIGVRLMPGRGDLLVVTSVMEGSPAQDAGLRVNDSLTDVNGIRLRNYEMLRDLLQLVQDQEVVLGVLRKDENVKVKITPRELDIPAGSLRGDGLPPIEIVPPVEVKPQRTTPEDQVLEELRGMRGLMEEMLMELRKQRSSDPPRSPRVRRVPMPSN